MDKLEYIQRRIIKLVRGLKTKSCEKQRRWVYTFSLQKRRLRGDVTVVLRHQNSCHVMEELDLFSATTRTNGLKLDGFRLDIVEEVAL